MTPRRTPQPLRCFTETIALATPLDDRPLERTYIRATADIPDAPGARVFEAASAHARILRPLAPSRDRHQPHGAEQPTGRTGGPARRSVRRAGRSRTAVTSGAGRPANDRDDVVGSRPSTTQNCSWRATVGSTWPGQRWTRSPTDHSPGSRGSRVVCSSEQKNTSPWSQRRVAVVHAQRLEAGVDDDPSLRAHRDTVPISDSDFSNGRSSVS